MTLAQFKALIIWILGLAIAVIGVLQTSAVITGTKTVGAVLTLAGALLPVVEHYISTSAAAPSSAITVTSTEKPAS